MTLTNNVKLEGVTKGANIFHMFTGKCYILFGKMSISSAHF